MREREIKRGGDSESQPSSVHQSVCSAIRASQQPASPIGFLFLKLPPPPCAVLLVHIYIISQLDLHTVDGCEILNQLVDSMVYPMIFKPSIYSTSCNIIDIIRAVSVGPYYPHIIYILWYIVHIISILLVSKCLKHTFATPSGAEEWPPPGLPKRCAGFSVFFGLASAAISWQLGTDISTTIQVYTGYLKLLDGQVG